jgi:hypothetical protein
MARSVRNIKLDSRAARQKLKPSGKPYYCSIGNGLDLGYRKGKKVRKWVERLYNAVEIKYALYSFADADDERDADGLSILSFHQAVTRVRERAEARAEEARIASFGPAITVREAIEPFMVMRDEREARLGVGAGLKRNARSRLTKHVLTDEALPEKLMATLTVDDLAGWARRLSGRVKAPERTVHDFKAALNAGAKRYAGQLPPNMRDIIRDGLASVRSAPSGAREAQVLARRRRAQDHFGGMGS